MTYISISFPFRLRRKNLLKGEDWGRLREITEHFPLDVRWELKDLDSIRVFKRYFVYYEDTAVLTMEGDVDVKDAQEYEVLMNLIREAIGHASTIIPQYGEKKDMFMLCAIVLDDSLWGKWEERLLMDYYPKDEFRLGNLRYSILLPYIPASPMLIMVSKKHEEMPPFLKEGIGTLVTLLSIIQQRAASLLEEAARENIMEERNMKKIREFRAKLKKLLDIPHEIIFSNFLLADMFYDIYEELLSDIREIDHVVKELQMKIEDDERERNEEVMRRSEERMRELLEEEVMEREAEESIERFLWYLQLILALSLAFEATQAITAVGLSYNVISLVGPIVVMVAVLLLLYTYSLRGAFPKEKYSIKGSRLYELLRREETPPELKLRYKITFWDRSWGLEKITWAVSLGWLQKNECKISTVISRAGEGKYQLLEVTVLIPSKIIRGASNKQKDPARYLILEFIKHLRSEGIAGEDDKHGMILLDLKRMRKVEGYSES